MINNEHTNVARLGSDYGYLNLIIRNDNPVNNPDEIVAEYKESRIEPYLVNMQDWEVSVVRFTVPSRSIPLFIFTENQVYQINFSVGPNYTNFGVPVDVPRIDRNNLPLSPGQPLFVYYYSQFITMVNLALENLWEQIFDSLDPIVAEARRGTRLDYPPYFEISDCGKIKLLLPVRYDETTPIDWKSGENMTSFREFGENSNFLNLHMSNELYAFFNGFPSFRFYREGSQPPYGANTTLDNALSINHSKFCLAKPCDSRIINGGANDTNIVGVGVPPADFPKWQIQYVEFEQDYSSLYAFQQLSRLLITTTLPIQKETVQVSGDLGLNDTLEVLTDFAIEPNTSGITREPIVYNADHVRWQNFTGTGDLNRVDCKIYFVTKDIEGAGSNRRIVNRRYPVKIGPSEEVTIKLEFKRRDHSYSKQISNYDTKLI